MFLPRSHIFALYCSDCVEIPTQPTVFKEVNELDSSIEMLIIET